MQRVLRNRDMETMAVLAFAALVFHLVTGWQWLLMAAAGLLACGIFIRPVAALLSRCWLRMAEILGRVNTRILLTLVFFLILTPIALLYRRFTNNPLQLKREPGGGTYFMERDHTYTPKDMEKMW
jgi:Saxitoxin biosynthesis operon protein SxtJ